MGHCRRQRAADSTSSLFASCLHPSNTGLHSLRVEAVLSCLCHHVLRAVNVLVMCVEVCLVGEYACVSFLHCPLSHAFPTVLCSQDKEHRKVAVQEFPLVSALLATALHDVQTLVVRTPVATCMTFLQPEQSLSLDTSTRPTEELQCHLRLVHTFERYLPILHAAEKGVRAPSYLRPLCDKQQLAAMQLVGVSTLTKPMSLAYSRKHWRQMFRPYLRIKPQWLAQMRLRGHKA